VDWGKAIVHFICGALLGAIAGFGSWAFWTGGESVALCLLFVVAGGLILGFLAAAFLEQFWESLKENWHVLWPF